MALDLVDLKRLKITPETLAWLKAESRSSGLSKQEILRDAIHQIAVQKIHAARLLAALAPAEARDRDSQGHGGPRR